MADEPIGIGTTPPDDTTPTLPGITVPPTTEPVTQTEAPPAPPETPVEPAIPDQGKTGGTFDLLDLAGLLLLLGIIALFVSLTGFFNWLIRNTLGRLFNAAGRPQVSSTAVGQAISNNLGQAFSGFDAQFGVVFQSLGEDVGQVGLALRNAEQTLFQAVSKLVTLEQSHTATKAQAETITVKEKPTIERVTTVEHKTKVKIEVDKVADPAYQQELDRLTHHITDIIDPELEALRHLIPKLEHGHASLWDEVSKHSEALGIAGLVAGTAAALAQLGGTWIRCENNQAIGESLCGNTGNLLKDLLNGLLDIGGLLALCPLVALLYDTAESAPVQDLLGGVTDGLEALLACRGIAPYTPPSVEAADVSPSLIGFAALAPLV